MMNDQIQSITKKYTTEEAMQMVLEFAEFDGDLGTSLKDFANNIFPKLLHGSPEEKKEAFDVFGKKARKVMLALETDTHVALMETFNSQYWGLVKEFSNLVIKDYNCSTNAEKALAEIIANAYVRVLDNSRRFNNCAEAGEYLSEVRTKHLGMLSKQIDRANRQFLHALVTLKQLKMPMVEMNINAKTAFFAQNQQINT